MLAADIHETSTRAAWLAGMLARWEALHGTALRQRGSFRVALSGGKTPPHLYAALGRQPDLVRHTDFFWGDERWVALDHADSNFRMARETLLDPAQIPAQRIHPWPTHLPPEAAAIAYENELLGIVGAPPVVDLVLLGIGPDGHTASLFPDTSALEERHRITVANPVPQIGATRLTLTFPAINAAREVWFLLAGSDKRSILNTVLQPDCPWPAAAVRAPAMRCFYCAE